MDDTHSEIEPAGADVISALEGMDPADAVEPAEEHASRLAERLEGVVGNRSEPEQLAPPVEPGEEPGR
jgi:hypothetical protein